MFSRVSEACEPNDRQLRRRFRYPATEAEERFDRARRRVGYWLGPALLVLVLLAPLPLTEVGHRLAAVMALVMTYWITEALPLPVTALLGPALAVVLGVARARDALAPFADPVIFLFLGSFLLAEALRVHGLDRRIALRILSLPGTASSPGRLRAAVALVTAGVSMWISNTATAAMMLPIVLGLVAALRAGGSAETPRALLLLMGMAASLGGVATPVGTPPNLIMLGFLRQSGQDVDFLRFMAMGVPLSLALTGVTLLLVRVLVPVPPGGADVAAHIAEERRGMGPWGAGQWACTVAFLVAVGLWLLPGVAAALGLARTGWFGALASLDEAIVALLAAVVLFAWPVKEHRALGWDEAAHIDWGTLLLFGGGLSLGKMMFDSGLAGWIGRGAIQATGVTSLWGLTALVLAVTIVLTETASNTATVTMLGPIVRALAEGLGVSPVPPLLAVGFGASMGFMFPVGTPPSAIVYGTGLVPMVAMMRVGVVVDIASFFVILGGLRLLCPLLGLQ